jgi:hypothetical protein
MSGLKKSIVITAVVAIPVELVNFFFFAFPIDVGLTPDAPWYSQLLGAEWVLLHLAGLRMTSRLDPYGKAPRVDYFVWFLSGYAGTALLLLAGITLIRALRRPAPKTPEMQA